MVANPGEMSALLFAVAVVLSGFAGALLLAGYLWYHHALRLHSESVFPKDAAGVVMLRYGLAAGFVTFGGFLLTFVLHLLALSAAGGNPDGPLVGLPYEAVSVGLLSLSIASFVVGGAGYATDALRNRSGDPR